MILTGLNLVTYNIKKNCYATSNLERRNKFRAGIYTR
jgi:hypothetical protein